MNPLLNSSQGMAMNVLEGAFKLYADTIDYPIEGLKMHFTSRQFTFRVSWKCSATNSWTSWETIKLSLQNFALDVFKAHGYLVLIDDPEVME
jgi:hypothetical protein